LELSDFVGSQTGRPLPSRMRVVFWMNIGKVRLPRPADIRAVPKMVGLRKLKVTRGRLIDECDCSRSQGIPRLNRDDIQRGL